MQRLVIFWQHLLGRHPKQPVRPCLSTNQVIFSLGPLRNLAVWAQMVVSRHGGSHSGHIWSHHLCRTDEWLRRRDL